MARDFHAEAGTHRARLAQAHRVAQCVEAIAARSAELLEYYEDEDDTRAEEIAGLGGPNPFTAFYARLRELREYHRRHPGLPAALPEAQERAHLAANPSPEFSGEEGHGRYLDLQVRAPDRARRRRNPDAPPPRSPFVDGDGPEAARAGVD